MSQASIPITKGGFANDGSEIFNSGSDRAANLAQLLDQQRTANNTVSVQVSGYALEHYYDIEGICRFIRSHDLNCIALQFPDELLVDSTQVLASLRAQMQGHGVSFYILGDTSYGSCCVDLIAASHVAADGLVHFGFACMTPTRGIPVYYVHGSRRFDQRRALTTFASPDTYRGVLSSLDENQLISQASLPVANVFIFYDRLYAHGIPRLAQSLADQGLHVCYNSEPLTSTRNDAIVESRPHNVRLIFASLSDRDEKTPDTGIGSSGYVGSILSLDFAGFELRLGADQFPLCKLEDDDTEDYEDPDTDSAEAEDESQSLALLKKRRKLLPPARNAFLIMSALTSSDEQSAQSAGQVAVVLRAPQATPLCDGFTSALLERSSSALLIHSVINLSGYVVASINVPPYIEASTENSQMTPFGCTVYSGQKRFTQLLGRRYYQVARARDSSVFGLVASALSSASQVAALHRLEKLAKSYGKKTYVLSVGKLNEPKLLNFPDIEVFVLVSCPFTSLVETPHGWAANLITAVELEFALTGAEWTGDYATDASSVVTDNERKMVVDNEATKSLETSVLLIDREEGPSMLALDEEEATQLEEITAASSQPDRGVASTEPRSSVKRSIKVTSVADEPTEAERALGFANDANAPRFSLVDQRLHVNVTRELVAATEQAQGAESKFLIEKVGSSSGALIEDISFKPFQRTFTGLDPTVENLPESAYQIQKGLHGVARSYVAFGEEYNTHPTTKR